MAEKQPWEIVWTEVMRKLGSDAESDLIGEYTYDQAYDFNISFSDLLVKTAHELFPESSKEVLNVLNNQNIVKNFFSQIDAKINHAQQAMNSAAGVGLKTVKVKAPKQLIVNEQATDNILSDIKRYTTALEVTGRDHIDIAQRANAKFHDGAGMDVTVTRIYDGVGINHREDRCEFCLSRCGTNVPYKQAVAIGMFDRHDGCGCKIVYTSSTGKVTTSTSKYGGFN